MTKRPAEVFGFPTDNSTPDAHEARANYWCPFADKLCNKQSRLIQYPMGVCSVSYGNEVVALSPRRFLQNNTVFYDIADRHFKSRNDLVVFSEVNLYGVGTFDYVMVKHKPLSSEIVDFAAIEFQTGQTTGTGKLIDALKEFMDEDGFKQEAYGFGLNLADIWKRTFTQILTKGVVLEHWNTKIFWVVQEPVYQNLLDRYGLHQMTYDPNHSTVFAIYDLRRSKDSYDLYQTRVESSTIDDLFDAFRNNLSVPSKAAFIKKLQSKFNDRMQLELHLGNS